ncbi:MAG: LysE family translocator [Poseidonibacter sp.]|uniref:LysE family translocator n=1 Tax=Poseidonibacter sp. TaxID=2321188 RepID=UPI00359CF19A
MNITTLLAIFSFSIVMSISPGPVNMLIITSGINNGFKKTVPFISGATIGFTLLLFLIAIGLKTILSSYSNFLFYLEIFGSAFIIYMGYKIATSNSKINIENKENKTLRFYEGFLLQWLNPKAWIACISGVSMFVNNDKTLFIFVFIYFIVCYLCLSFWGILGEKITIFLNTNLRLEIFNMIMGSILIFSTLFLISRHLL